MRTLGEEERLRYQGVDRRPWMSAPLMSRLAAYHWPGNVRQLQNVVRELVVASRGRSEVQAVAKVERLLTGEPSRSPEPKRAEPSRPVTPGYRDPEEVAERELREALRHCRWNVSQTTARLGVSRTSLYDLMARYRIPRASDLDGEEIERAVERGGGSLEAAAEYLEVSKRGLKLRMGQLGLRRGRS